MGKLDRAPERLVVTYEASLVPVKNKPTGWGYHPVGLVIAN